MEKRRLWGGLIVALQYLKGTYKKEGRRGFVQADSSRTRGKGFKLKEDKCSLDIGKKFFTQRVVKCWNWLPREVVGVQGQVGWSPEQLDLVEGIPADSRGVGTR